MNDAAPCGRHAKSRIDAVDWDRVAANLDGQGSAVIPQLLTAAECEALARLYGEESRFRSRVVMSRHGYGRGEYQYFSYPLPELVAGLRTNAYPHLVPIANRWNQAMGLTERYPDQHGEFIERCHAAGQIRPTPLLLQYGENDYNCLHQDLYGEHAFPLQMAILLSKPGEDFTGGEFVLTEQRPRMQSRPEVVPLSQGDAVGVRRSSSSRARHARHVSGEPAARREHGTFRASAHAWRDFSRREMIAAA